MSQREEDLNVEKTTRKTGMAGFIFVWIGQLFSLLGTSMTGFALAIWIYSITVESFRATAFALVGFFSFAPLIFASPIAGAYVDRYDRKKIMIFADLAAGLPTVAVLILYTFGQLQLWQLFITGAVAASFQAFHFPAYSAAVTTMIRKEQYGRASGMLAAAQFSAGILAPILAALVLAFADLRAVLAIDIFTFFFAISILLFVHIPKPMQTESGRKAVGSIWRQSLYGFRYIYERRSLLGLQLTFFCINFIGTFGNILLAPMILTRAGDEQLGRIILGSVLSAGGIGGLLGSVVLSIWGGPKRKTNGLLVGMALISLFGPLLTGLGREITIWAAASFISLFFLPIVNGSSQAIWQSKVAPDVQGRVFATRLLIAQISVPISMLLAGPLADWVFEPTMKDGGLLTAFSPLVGTEPGAGMSLMFVITGLLGIVVAFGAYGIRAIRNAEDILPDYDVGAKTPSEPSPENKKETRELDK